MSGSSCAVCGGKMVEGFIKDPHSSAEIHWIPYGVTGFWKSLIGARNIQVITMACSQCGRLQSSIDPGDLRRLLRDQ